MPTPTLTRRAALRGIGALATIPLFGNRWHPDEPSDTIATPPTPEGRIGQRGGWRRVARFIVSYERRAIVSNYPHTWQVENYQERIEWQPGVLCFLAVGPPEANTEALARGLAAIERERFGILGAARTRDGRVGCILYSPVRLKGGAA